jgi:hypothetical protein
MREPMSVDREWTSAIPDPGEVGASTAGWQRKGLFQRLVKVGQADARESGDRYPVEEVPERRAA